MRYETRCSEFQCGAYWIKVILCYFQVDMELVLKAERKNERKIVFRNFWCSLWKWRTRQKRWGTKHKGNKRGDWEEENKRGRVRREVEGKRGVEEFIGMLFAAFDMDAFWFQKLIDYITSKLRQILWHSSTMEFTLGNSAGLRRNSIVSKLVPFVLKGLYWTSRSPMILGPKTMDFHFGQWFPNCCSMTSVQ